METQDHRRMKLLTLLVAILTAAFLVETYCLVRMQRCADAMTVSAQTTQPQPIPIVPNPAQTTIPAPNMGPRIDPFDAGAMSPFGGAWDPLAEMNRMRDQMDRLFDNAFGQFQTSPRFGNLAREFPSSPKLDMTETDANYVVRMDLPGADKSKIDAKLEDRTLIVTAKRDEQVSQGAAQSGKTLRSERILGQFERSVTLPGPVKPEGMTARYENGVLTVTIPKDTTPGARHTIPIQ